MAAFFFSDGVIGPNPCKASRDFMGIRQVARGNPARVLLWVDAAKYK